MAEAAEESINAHTGKAGSVHRSDNCGQLQKLAVLFLMQHRSLPAKQ